MPLLRMPAAEMPIGVSLCRQGAGPAVAKDGRIAADRLDPAGARRPLVPGFRIREALLAGNAIEGFRK